MRIALTSSILAATLALAACGGGGGGGDKAAPTVVQSLSDGSFKIAAGTHTGTFKMDTTTAPTSFPKGTTNTVQVLGVVPTVAGAPEFKLVFRYDTTTGVVDVVRLEFANGDSYACGQVTDETPPLPAHACPSTAAFKVDLTNSLWDAANVVLTSAPAYKSYGTDQITVSQLRMVWTPPTI